MKTNISKENLKILWLCPYPVDTLPETDVKWNKRRRFHPAGWIKCLSEELSKEDSISLNILTITPWVSKNYIFEHNNIKFYILKSPYKIPFVELGYPAKFPLNRLTHYYLDKIKIDKYIKIIKPDLIHVFGTETRYGLSVIELKGPVLISIQGPIGLYARNLKSNLSNIDIQIENKIIRNSKYFAGTSEWTFKYIKEINKDAIILKLPEAVNKLYFEAEKLSEEEKDVDILYYGTLEKRKGIETLLDIIPSLLKTQPKLSISIIGNGNSEYVDYLKNKCELSNIANNIVWLGRLLPEQVKNIFERTKIYVFPTLIDNTPNSVIEALAAGVPVITNNVGGLKSLITNFENGILFDKDNINDLSKNILNLLKDLQLRNKLSENARKLAYKSNYPEVISKKAIIIYNELIHQSQ